jgi:hypothetical protein
VGQLDAVLLSHDQHDDNLDSAAGGLLPGADAVITTIAGAKRLGGDARGLAPWATTRFGRMSESAARRVRDCVKRQWNGPEVASLCCCKFAAA